MSGDHNHDPLRPHAHDPNPEPPSDDPTFILNTPSGISHSITVSYLQALPEITLPNCYIVSTGHGTSGPFTFRGVTLLELVRRCVDGSWSEIEVVSADGFGNRIFREELEHPDAAGPIVLAYAIDGEMMTREQGLVRMIVPSERDDALRQVKWVGQINVLE